MPTEALPTGSESGGPSTATGFPNPRLRGKWLFALVFFFVGGLSIYTVFTFNLCGSNPIRSDGIGYYLYLPATFMHRDLTFRTASKLHFQNTPPTGCHVDKASGNYVMKYWSAQAILMSPFFFLGWAIAILTGYAQDGFSLPFQVTAATSGLFYATVGILLLWRVLEKEYRQSTVFLAMTAIFLGSNLYHYSTMGSILSHAYSFFLFCAFLFLTVEVYARGSSVPYLLAIGATSAMIILTRPTNAIWLTFGLFYGINSVDDFKQRMGLWLRNFRKAIFIAGPLFLLLSIQLVYWKIATGRLLVYSYAQEGFNFFKPEILNVLFSVRTGLFFWSPVLLLVFPGLYYVYRNKRQFFLPIVIYFPLNVYVISSWWCWWYGTMHFGHRPFVESMPMFAICICSLSEGVRNPLINKAIIGYVAVCCLFTTWLMARFWCGSIPSDHATIADIWENFFYLSLY